MFEPLCRLQSPINMSNFDRRKLKKRVFSRFGSADEKALLVRRASSSDEVIPTVYTLRACEDLLPVVTTSPETMSLIEGSNRHLIQLRIMNCAPGLQKAQLVARHRTAPLAVDHLLPASDELESGGRQHKKLVSIIHVWEDHLCRISKRVVAVPPRSSSLAGSSAGGQDDAGDDAQQAEIRKLQAMPHPRRKKPTLPREAVRLTRLPMSPSSFPYYLHPVPGTTFYFNHVLPSRPAMPELVRLPSPGPSVGRSSEISLKTSAHKPLVALLKSVEKAGLLSIKASHKRKNDIMVTSVNAAHPNQRRAEATDEEPVHEAVRPALEVTDLWKPHLRLSIVRGMGMNTDKLYTSPLMTILNTWLEAQPDAIRSDDPQLIDLTTPTVASLAEVLFQGGARTVDTTKRGELLKKLRKLMEAWYEMKVGDDSFAMRQQAALQPIKGMDVMTILGFKPYGVILNMNEDLRDLFATSLPMISECLLKKGIPKNRFLMEGLTKTQKED
ncbi:hypothetical protein HDZ31DRAFT_83708 [Schizophyllum fasciatum]